MNKREMASLIAAKTGFNDLVGNVQSVLSQRLTILAYHRVMDVDRDSYPFDLSLVSATPHDFEQQLNYIKEHFTPVQFSEVVDFIDNGSELPKRPIVVTFDDGFIDNYHTVFPIAKKTGVPITIFISTDYMDKDDTYWFEKLAYLFTQSEQGTLELGSGFEYQLGATIWQRREAYCDFVEKIKYIDNEERTVLLNQLFDRYAHIYGDKYREDMRLSRPMSWDQVKEMSSRGIEFGSHGVTHNILTTMGAEEIREELSVSKREIERNIGNSATVFAYPNGMHADYNDQVQSILDEERYQLAVCYISGATSKDDLKSRRYQLQRVHVNNDASFNLFEAMLSFPERLV